VSLHETTTEHEATGQIPCLSPYHSATPDYFNKSSKYYNNKDCEDYYNNS
jgi:hypothetical protein